MAGIKLGDFRGARPRQSSRLLEPREGQTALDVRLGSGELRPLRGLTSDGAWAKTGPILSLFPYEHPISGLLWLHWDSVVDVVAGPNYNDANKRLYFTGDGQPKMTFDDLVVLGEGEMGDTAPGEFPRDWRYLGIPPPPPLELDEIRFTAPKDTVTVTSIKAFAELEDDGRADEFWPNMEYVPQSVVWGGNPAVEGALTPPSFDLSLQLGDEFLVEVINATQARISTPGRTFLVPATERTIPDTDVNMGIFGTVFEIIYGVYLTSPNFIGTYPDGHTSCINCDPPRGIIFRRLRPLNGALLTFEQPHGLSSGEYLRVTNIGSLPVAQGAALYTPLTGGSLANYTHWRSETELEWLGNVEFNVIRDGIGSPSGTIEARSYLYTYVSDLGEEGPPAHPTVPVTLATSDGVLLSGFEIPVFPKRVITHIRVYRSDSNDANAEYRFVTELAIADIDDYVPPVVDATIYGGTVTAPGAGLSSMAPTTVTIADPLSTAGTTISLKAVLFDEKSSGLPPSETILNWQPPVWSVQFQSSLDNIAWIAAGLPVTVTGAAYNSVEAIPTVSYYSVAYLTNVAATRTFTPALAVGTDIYFRAVVTYVSGEVGDPVLVSLEASEPLSSPEPVFTPVTGFSYLDLLLPYELGEVLPSDTWFPPATNMHSITLMPNGIAVGAYERTVAFCEPYRPHAWPPEYEQTIDYDVVGLGVFGNSVIVCTTGTPYVITGTHPRNASMRRIEVNQACVAKRSIASVGVGVLYATPDGLGFASNKGFTLITAGHFSRDDWQALNPESMIGLSHDEKYVCFYTLIGGTTGAFVFDPQHPEVGLSFTTDTDILGGHVNLLDDTLYLSNGTHRLTWDTGLDRTYTWRSKLLSMPYAINPAVARVLSDGYPVTFRLYGDNVLRHTRVVANKEAFRLPSGYLASEFEVELSSSKAVRNVWVGETFSEVLEG